MYVCIYIYIYIYIYIVTCLTAQCMDNFKVTYSEFINKLHVQQMSKFKWECNKNVSEGKDSQNCEIKTFDNLSAVVNRSTGYVYPGSQTKSVLWPYLFIHLCILTTVWMSPDVYNRSLMTRMTLNYTLSEVISEFFLLAVKIFCVNECKLSRHWGYWSHSCFCLWLICRDGIFRSKLS